MTNMSKDEKRMMLFDMQEHPEKYTDEQVEYLLADTFSLLNSILSVSFSFCSMSKAF